MFPSLGQVNRGEAWAIASLIVAASEHPAYHDSTFEVISVLGDEQALSIDGLLRRVLPLTEYQQCRIRCGNSAQFQGDERDLVFLSIVHAPTGDGPLGMLSDLDNRTRKRLNVAASRARDQMWSVHSLDPLTDLEEEDLRKRLEPRPVVLRNGRLPPAFIIDWFLKPGRVTRSWNAVRGRRRGEDQPEPGPWRRTFSLRSIECLQCSGALQ